MASVVDKVKAKVEHVLHKDKDHTTGTHVTGTHTTGTHTAGPHSSNIANKADPRVDSDRDGSHNLGAASYGPGGHTTHTGVGSHGYSSNTGPHDSNLANKPDPRVDSDRDGSRNMGAANYGPGAHNPGHPTGLTGQHHTPTAGPHDSNLANKADPRVDSDRDGSRNLGAANYGPGGHNTGHTTGLTGQHHTTTAGPHDSNLANKLDPRVDSDRDGSRNMGAASYGPGGHATGHNTSMLGGSHSTNTGPHDSNLANKLDPRVDSDRDGSRNMGAANYGPGGHATGHNTSMLGGSHSTNAGPHDYNLANKADPRVDSDRDGSRNLGMSSHGPHSGTGPATNTAGPHGSNLANKLDPRVDSDLDGGRTLGGNPQTRY